ncbi:MAG: hydroxymethylbilane synthase [Dehalococcoidia bacterium]|nr:hydroxymethylbilane synthase [Dehalococcoidia bacterium]
MANRRTLLIGTRGSRLARAQAEAARGMLSFLHPDRDWLLREIRSEGDVRRQASLASIGGRGVFVKALEDKLLAGEIDLAVHSLKDMPTQLTTGLKIGAVLPREDARDALVSRGGLTLDDLPSGAVVGSGSARRRAQLLAYRSDLVVQDVRGNVDTRLRKLSSGGYDAMILAAAALIRLQRTSAISQWLPLTLMLPAVGQGALAVEVRESDEEVRELVQPLNHRPTERAVSAERAFLLALGGGCTVPVAAYAAVAHGRLLLQGLVANLNGKKVIRDSLRGSSRNAEAAGRRLAARMLSQGAAQILREAAGGQ